MTHDDDYEKLISDLDTIIAEINSQRNGAESVLLDSHEVDLYYRHITRRERRWKESKRCMYPGCGKTSIPKCHSIQETSLKAISEHFHVLKPYFNEIKGKMDIKKIGLTNASTFPGFCKDHENLFAIFERNKQIQDENDCVLQIFRTICREIAFKRNEIKSILKHQNDLLKLRRQRISDVHSQQQNKPINNLLINLYSVKRLHEHMMSLHKFYIACKEGFAHANNIQLHIKALTIDCILPVCISGISNTPFKIYHNEANVVIVLNVIPFVDNTVIIAATLSQYKELLNSWWKFYTQNNISILSMIETFMIHGSDHWYIQPSVWYDLGTTSQNVILNNILNTEYNIFIQYYVSIFNQLRRDFIRQLETQNVNSAYSIEIDHLIKHERRKVDPFGI